MSEKERRMSVIQKYEEIRANLHAEIDDEYKRNKSQLMNVDESGIAIETSMTRDDYYGMKQ